MFLYGGMKRFLNYFASKIVLLGILQNLNLFIEILCFAHYSNPSKWYIYTTGQIKDSQRWALCNELTHRVQTLKQELHMSTLPFHIIKTILASNIIFNEQKFTLIKMWVTNILH